MFSVFYRIRNFEPYNRFIVIFNIVKSNKLLLYSIFLNVCSIKYYFMYYYFFLIYIKMYLMIFDNDNFLMGVMRKSISAVYYCLGYYIIILYFFIFIQVSVTRRCIFLSRRSRHNYCYYHFVGAKSP